MRRTLEPFSSFVGALHRRAVLIRIGESIGLTLCAASILCLLILPILIYRAEPVFPLLSIAGALAVLSGILLGIIRRPTLLTTLIDADRQFNLHDLLSTAWSNRGQNEPWAQMVVALAERRSRQLHPNQLVLARLGARAWGGIGLSVATVLTLALIPLTQPRQVAARGEERSGVAVTDTAHDRDAFEVSTAISRTTTRPPRGDELAETPDASRMQIESTADGRGEQSHQVADPSGAGGGIGQSSDRTKGRTGEIDATGRTATGEGEATAGAGRSGPSGMPGESSGRADPAPHRPVAPWQSHDWSSARNDAQRAVRDGTVPDHYRDLVRDYFDRNRAGN